MNEKVEALNAFYKKYILENEYRFIDDTPPE